MDATLKALLEVVAAIGVIALFALLLIYVFILKQRSDIKEKERQDAITTKILSIIEEQNKNNAHFAERLAKQDDEIDLIRKTVELLTQSLEATSAAKQATIDHNTEQTAALKKVVEDNTQAFMEFRNANQKAFDETVKRMEQNAQDRAAKEALTVGALTGVQTSLEAHTASAKDLEKRMNDMQDDFLQKMQTNGDETRKKFEPVMDELTAIKAMLEQLCQAIPDQQEAIKAIEKKFDVLAGKVDSLVSEQSKPPAPPVDPLANVPPKAEELK